MLILFFIFITCNLYAQDKASSNYEAQDFVITEDRHYSKHINTYHSTEDTLAIIQNISNQLNHYQNYQNKINNDSADIHTDFLYDYGWMKTYHITNSRILINIQDPLGRTPLHWGIITQNFALIEQALNQGANITIADAKGCTPLHMAINAKLIDIAILLITRGADINAQNEKGYSPLHLAVWSDHNLALIKYLIHNGANPNLRTKNGKTALDLAIFYKNYQLIDYLKASSKYSTMRRFYTYP